jgi:hypothetical protein
VNYLRLRVIAIALLVGTTLSCSVVESVHSPQCNCPRTHGSVCSAKPPQATPLVATEKEGDSQEVTELLSVDESPAGNFATILVDAPVYLEAAEHESPIGPVGYLRKGAIVYTIHRSNLPDYTRVNTAFPMPMSWIISDADLTKSRGYLFAKSGLEVLIPRVVTRRNWSKLGNGDSIDWGYYRTLHLRPGGIQFSFVLCGRVRELERRNGYVFVAAEFPTGELWGWVSMRPSYPSNTNEKGKDLACSQSIPEGRPSDYSFAHPPMPPLNKRMTVGDEFFYVRRTATNSGRLECQHVRLAKNEKSKGMVIQYLRADGGVDKTRRISVGEDRAYIDKAELLPDGTVISSNGGVGSHMRAVTEDHDSLGFVEFGTTDTEYNAKVTYFHRVATDWWDRTLERCQERLPFLQDAMGPYN